MTQKRQKDGSTRRCPEFLFSEHIRRLVLCLLGAALVSASATAEMASSKSPEELEYEVKAAFIYNFMKFIEWPGTKKIAADSNQTVPVTIAYLGKHPYKKSFQLILDKTVQGRPIRLLELESFESFRASYDLRQSALEAYKSRHAAQLAECYLLFICSSEKNCLPDVLKLTEGKAVVTVSDLPDFAAGGGAVGFIIENKKVRFEINLDAVQKEKLKISSQLLGLAKRVYKTEEK